MTRRRVITQVLQTHAASARIAQLEHANQQLRREVRRLVLALTKAPR